MHSFRSKTMILVFAALPALLVSANRLAAAQADPAKDTEKSPLWLLIAPPDPLAYYDKYPEGIRLFYADKFKEAEPLLEAAARDYPSDGITWLYLGMTKHSLRKPDEAIAAYKRAKELHTKVASWFIDYALAQVYASQQDKENTLRSLKALLDVYYVFPQQLHDKKMFAFLKEDPRFKKLVGKFEVAGLSRDDGWRNDLDALVEHIHQISPELRGRALPAVFQERYKTLKRDIPKLDDDHAYMGIMHMVAALHQGHTGIFPLPESKMTRGMLPVDFYAFPEGVFIVSADEANKDLIGSQLLAIENVPTAALLDRLAGYATVESPPEILTQSMLTMANLPSLRGIDVVKPGVNEARLSLREKNGAMLERTIKAIPPPMSTNNHIMPPPDVPAPLFLKNTKRKHWFEKLPDGSALYVQVNNMVDDPDETLPEFGLKLQKYLAENAPKNVIVDLRHNNGGTTQRYPELLRALIAHSVKPGNRLYVLIGRSVYSACANFVTDLERLAKPTFVGEPTSGWGNQHGDSTYFTLPYSGIGCQLSGMDWQLATPMDKRRFLVPDIPVQLTAKDWLAGRDPALELVMKHMNKPDRPAVPDFP